MKVNASFLIINKDAFLLRCKLGKTIISIRTAYQKNHMDIFLFLLKTYNFLHQILVLMIFYLHHLLFQLSNQEIYLEINNYL